MSSSNHEVKLPTSQSAETLPSTNATSVLIEEKEPASLPTPSESESMKDPSSAVSPIEGSTLLVTEGNANEPSAPDSGETNDLQSGDNRMEASATTPSLPRTSPTPEPLQCHTSTLSSISVPVVKQSPGATKGSVSEPSTPVTRKTYERQSSDSKIEASAAMSSLPPTPPTPETTIARKNVQLAVPKTEASATASSLPPTAPTSESAQTRKSALSTVPKTEASLQPTPSASESGQARTSTSSLASPPAAKASPQTAQGPASEPCSPDTQAPQPRDTQSPSDPIDELLVADKPPLPTPRPPNTCPLFCCFYAEFDIVKGPKVAYQSPKGFMDQDTGVSTEDIHQLLEDTFHRVQAAESEEERIECEAMGQSDGADEGLSDDVGTLIGEDDSLEGSLSIFDATSEYVITGNELAGKMINLSTHNMHILTRPTVIADERYARNALLFCVGFVIRRSEDPRPFRPLLCKWADALRSMEVESHFLTNPTLRWRLQPMLDRLLVSLNSSQNESNLLLDSANALNLRAFLPPKSPALPVPDYAVPILVREDLLSLYDWDLAIQWVVLFIDGVNNARWIATKSVVDMEMVRACLRVLKHHGIIELLDMFFYSNRYEFTERATAMLAGKEPKLLQEAMEYITRRHHGSESGTPPSGLMGEPADNNLSSSGRHLERSFLPISEEMVSPSFPPMARSIPGSFMSSGSFQNRFMHLPSEAHRFHFSRDLQKRMKLAIAELYCSCNRNTSFAELRIAMTAECTKPAALGPTHRETGQVADEMRSRRLVSPSEFSHLERNKKASKHGVDWNEAFEELDHRRFATFGVARGLLRRVHNYPLAIETRNLGADTLRQAHFEEKKESTAICAQERAGGNRRSRSFEKEQMESQISATRVATMMDGTRCDDELICEFERPLHELFRLVEATGRKVVSIYAVAPKRS